MRDLLIITAARIKLLLRKRLLLALCIVLPIIFYLIIGQIFAKSEAYNKIPIVVIDEDNTKTSKLISEKLKSNETLECYEQNIEKSLLLLEESKIEGIYIFKKGFEENIKKDNLKGLIDVYYLPQNTAAVGLTDMVAGEIMPVVCYFKVGAIGEDLYKQYNSSESNIISEKIIKYAKDLESDESFRLPIIIKSTNSKAASNAAIKFDRSDLGKRAVIGMIILFNTLFILSNYSGIMRERTNNIYKRIKAAGVSKLSIICADTLGIIIVGSLMGIIQIVLLYPIFKFKNITTVMSIMSIYLFYTYCTAAMLILFTRIFKNYVSLQGFIPQFVFFIALLGGCLLGIELIPRNIRILSVVMPTYWANDALTKIVLYGFSINTVLLNLLILASMGTVFTLLSLLNENDTA